MADYCSSSDIYAQTPESGISSSDYADALSAFITAASRAIDREVGRWDNYFYPSTSDETRYFDGNGESELWVDEFISLTSLAVSDEGGLASTDYAIWSSSDYLLAPYNAAAIGQPYKKLIVDTLNGAELDFPRYRKCVKMIGVFGYSATPPAMVKQACIIQTLRWHMRAKQMYQDIGAGAQFAQFTVTGNLDPDIARLLMPYKANSIAEMD